MTDLRQAAQNVVDAWNGPRPYHSEYGLLKAFTALETALAAPQPQPQPQPEPEPVAFYDFGNHRMRWAKPTVYDQLVSVDVPELPLYLHPPQRQPLTDEQINGLALADDGSLTVRDFVRAIEKAHGIGGDK